MNKVLKRISAVTLSLAVIGTASVIPVKNSPMINTAVVASAANYDNAYWNYTRPTGGKRDTASKVKWIQAAINYYFNSNKLDVDGSYGPLTRSAVADFQRSYNKYYSKAKGFSIAVDGDFGPETFRAFEALYY